MDLTLLALLSAAFFLSAFVKGLTGLGFSTTCLAVLALVLDVKTAMPLVIVPSIVSNIITMRTAGHFRETVVRFWPLFVTVIPGLILGLWLLSGLDTKVSGAALGLILIIYVCFAFLNPHYSLPRHLRNMLAIPTGFVTGFINGITGSQVMPVLPYLLSLQMDNNRFVQAINCSFTLSSLIMAAGLVKLGYMTLNDVSISLSALVFVFIGVYTGTLIRRRLSTALFRKLVLMFLVILGIGLILKLQYT